MYYVTDYASSNAKQLTMAMPAKFLAVRIRDFRVSVPLDLVNLNVWEAIDCCVLYNIFTTICNAVDFSMRGSNKEHKFKKEQKDWYVAVVEKHMPNSAAFYDAR